MALERRLSPGRRALLMTGAAWVGLGGRTLRRTATRMADLVDAGDRAARRLAPALVARRPDGLDGPELVRATVESLAENTADAVGGPLVWGAVAARRSDGHRGEHARRDGRLSLPALRALRLVRGEARRSSSNWPVARATAAATVAAAGLCGEYPRGGVATWRRDGARRPSPNAGARGGGVRRRAGNHAGWQQQLRRSDRTPAAARRRPAPGHGRAAPRLRLSAVTTYVLAAAAAALAMVRPWR